MFGLWNTEEPDRSEIGTFMAVLLHFFKWKKKVNLTKLTMLTITYVSTFSISTLVLLLLGARWYWQNLHYTLLNIGSPWNECDIRRKKVVSH